MDPRNPARLRRFGHEDDEERGRRRQSPTLAIGENSKASKAFVILGSCERSECGDPGDPCRDGNEAHVSASTALLRPRPWTSPPFDWLKVGSAHENSAGLAHQPDFPREADA
ncbi:protein of unknown function [Aminobacter niigataensis]|nr:protein of unknown function [Aminobacter niigataensis]